MPQQTTINCPQCGTEININTLLFSQIEDEMKKKFKSEVTQHRQKYSEAVELLKTEEAKVKKKQQKFDTILNEAVETRFLAEKEILTSSLKEKMKDEQSAQLSLMQEELDEKSEQLRELNRTKAEIEQLHRKNNEMEEKFKLEAEQMLTVQLKKERQKIQKVAQDQNELKLKEKEKQLSDLKDKLEEARRKAEQGSQQMQGEVQELAIEEWLRVQFPFDQIQEIKKGIRGADCMQVVHTREIQNCGTIYYESKRTKDFQRSWIEKFKEDIRDKGADIGILVTEVLPKEMERMGLLDGIWVCTYEEFKALAFILRENIVKLSLAIHTQENKSEKTSLLYNYLTSTEFRMQIEAIVEGFTQMQSDLESEKRAMGRIWKQREKQISKVLDNTVGMYGSVRGIAGSAVGSIQALELAYGCETIEEETI